MYPFERLQGFQPSGSSRFSSARGIKSGPTFVWWLPFTLRNRDKIISAIIARTNRVSHNYGVQLPSTVQEAYDLDEANGNTLWHNYLNKEM